MSRNKSNGLHGYQSNQSRILTINVFLLLCIWCPLVIIVVLYSWLGEKQLLYFDIWVFGVAGFWIIYQFFFRSNEHISLIKTYFNFLIIFVLFFSIFQWLPLPANVIKLFSPKIWYDTQMIMTNVPWIFDTSHGATLSYCNDKSFLFSMHGIACMVFFLLLVHTIKTRFQLNLILNSLLGAMFIGTIVGCFFFYDWSQTKPIPSVSHHTVIILHLMIPMSLGLLMTYYRQTKKPVFKTFFYSMKMTFKHLIAGQHAPLMKIALGMIILIGCIFISNSFGLKIISLSVSLLIGGGLLTNKKKLRSWVIIWCGAGLAVGIYALMSNSTQAPRLLDSLMTSTARDYPLTGIGYGALPLVASKYSDWVCNGEPFQYNQYSGWIKLLLEFGLIGTVLWIVSLLIFILRMNNMWLKRQSSFSNGWALGLMMGLISVGLFGIGYGFGNIYITLPIIAAVAACGFLVLHAGHHTSRQPFFYRTISFQRKSWKAFTIVTLLLIFILMGMIRILVINNSTNLSSEFVMLSSERECLYQLKKNMFKPYLWFDMAKKYRLQTEDPLNHVKIYLPRADVCYEIACYLSPNNSQMILDAAKYWVFRSQMLEKQSKKSFSNSVFIIPKTQEEGILNFQKKFRTILEKHPEKLKRVIDAVWQGYPSDVIVLGAIPENQTLKQAALEYVLLSKK